ncbi:MAG: TetR family transcriptional regulator C-terminal domain-containing protein [Pseudonocardiaceae bacterium]
MAGLRRWRDALVTMNQSSGGVGGCPVGSLASEQSERARMLLTHSFRTWESYLAEGLQAMRNRGELTPNADPHDLATAIMTALQGGLLLAVQC